IASGTTTIADSAAVDIAASAKLTVADGATVQVGTTTAATAKLNFGNSGTLFGGSNSLVLEEGSVLSYLDPTSHAVTGTGTGLPEPTIDAASASAEKDTESDLQKIDIGPDEAPYEGELYWPVAPVDYVIDITNSTAPSTTPWAVTVTVLDGAGSTVATLSFSDTALTATFTGFLANTHTDFVFEGDTLGTYTYTVTAKDSGSYVLATSNAADMKVCGPYDGKLVSISTSIAPDSVVDVKGASTATGATALIWPDQSGSNQRFTLVESTANPGYYAIVSVNSGYVLSTSGGSTDDGTAIVQLPDAGEDSQLWEIVTDGSGVAFLSKADPTKAIDVFEENPADGTKLILWPYTAAKANQVFELNDVTQPTVGGTPLADGTYKITADSNGLSLDVFGNSMTAGAEVIVWTGKTAPDDDNQKFDFTYEPSTGYYIITVHSSGLTLDAFAGGAPGAKAIQWTAKTTDVFNQRWSIEDDGTGKVVIRSAKTHNVLDVFGNGTAPGTSVIVWPENGQSNQLWSLT
ncbi:MAG: RICIN domain-containing protein, partial [Coriobacteriales bacterium]|nr:RICIN domain-containing protein [Coriobacteriales bacterium]